MKKLITISFALLIGVSAFAQKKKGKQAESAQPELKNYKDSASYALGVLYASSFRDQGFDSLDKDMIIRVFSDVINNNRHDTSLLIKKDPATQILNQYMMKKQEMAGQQNLAIGKAFLEKNKTAPGVVTLPSGLQYKVIKQGEGAKPLASSTVTVHYTGTLIDGRIFDSSVKRGEPASFPVNGVIKGWTEALQLMTVGSKWILYIPSDLAYGQRSMPNSIITANSTLIFEVELLSIAE